jgi:hypothetical protein
LLFALKAAKSKCLNSGCLTVISAGTHGGCHTVQADLKNVRGAKVGLSIVPKIKMFFLKKDATAREGGAAVGPKRLVWGL